MEVGTQIFQHDRKKDKAKLLVLSYTESKITKICRETFLRFKNLDFFVIGAFELIETPIESDCQDFFCKAFSECNFWIYNRETRECYLYENEPVDRSSCDIVGGIPWDDPDGICDDAQNCEVCRLL